MNPLIQDSYEGVETFRQICETPRRSRCGEIIVLAEVHALEEKILSSFWEQ